MADEIHVNRMPVPHAGQDQVLNLRGRFRVAVCGRRFGKTVAAAIAAVRRCAKDDQRVWWISPVQEQSDRVERDVARWLLTRKEKDGGTGGGGDGRTLKAGALTKADDDIISWKHLKSEHALVCSNGSRIEFKSAHVPDNLRGAGLDLLVVDEAADVSDYTWKMVLKPMLLDSLGEAYILGTPRGTQNWLHRVFLLGQNENKASGYASLQLATRSNPRLKESDVNDFRLEMSEDEFRQEFEAEFIDGVNAAFSKIDEAIDGERMPRGIPGARYVTGIDLGQRVDFSVLCSVNCRTQRAEGFARFNKLDWSEQLGRIEAHLNAFPGPCVVDATGLGGPVVEQIEKLPRVRVERFIFTAQSRRDLISGLHVAFSHGTVKLAKIPELINELKGFTLLEKRDAGGVTHAYYGAPDGLHDDCVMALGLAWWGLTRRGLWSVAGGNPLRGGIF